MVALLLLNGVMAAESIFFVNYGYKFGRSAVSKILKGGLMSTIIHAAGIVGCAVMGALTANYVNLTTKLARDEESAAMFDIIFETKYYDLGKVFAWGSIEGIIGATVKAGGGFASTYAKSESKILDAMAKTWEFYGN